MFIRKDIVKIPNGIRMVPFCKECNSMNIKITKTCLQCGSDNIIAPSMKDITLGYDGSGVKQEFKEMTEYIYTCDKCKKEFCNRDSDNFISYYEGEFESYKLPEDLDPIIYNLNKDLCKECKQKIVKKLRLKLLDVTNVYNVQKEIEQFMED